MRTQPTTSKPLLGVDDQIEYVSRQLSRRARDATIPIFAEIMGEDRKVKSVLRGNSVFCSLLCSDYLLTAAHVLRFRNKSNVRLSVFGEKREAVYLRGEATSFSDRRYSNEDDPFDLAALRLENSISEILRETYQPVGRSEAILPVTNLAEGWLCFVYGYPASAANFYHPDGPVAVPQQMTLSFSGAHVSRSNRLRPEYNFGMSFNSRKMKRFGKDGIVRSKKIDGMSGCGIWTSPSLSEAIEPRLLGFLIEQTDSRRRTPSELIGTYARQALTGLSGA